MASDPDDHRDGPTREEPPRHPDEAAELRERSDGAHAEQLSDEGTLRAVDTPPGVDPERDGTND
jgi:hypothetical protein